MQQKEDLKKEIEAKTDANLELTKQTAELEVQRNKLDIDL
jgi:hypothetical protein